MFRNIVFNKYFVKVLFSDIFWLGVERLLEVLNVRHLNSWDWVWAEWGYFPSMTIFFIVKILSDFISGEKGTSTKDWGLDVPRNIAFKV